MPQTLWTILSFHNLLLQIHFLTTTHAPYKFATIYTPIKTLKAILLPYLALIKKSSLYQRFFSTQVLFQGAGWEDKDVPDVGCCTVRKRSGTLVMGTASQRGGEEVHPPNTSSSQRDKWVQLVCWTLLKPLVPWPSHTICPGRLLAVGRGNTQGERSFTECALCLACPRALRGLNNRNHRQN